MLSQKSGSSLLQHQFCDASCLVSGTGLSLWAPNLLADSQIELPNADLCVSSAAPGIEGHFFHLKRTGSLLALQETSLFLADSD
jgi:hypothetical protein